MSPEQARFFWERLGEGEMLRGLLSPMAIVGAAVAFIGSDHAELADHELVEAAQGLGFAVTLDGIKALRAVLALGEEASASDVAGSLDEPFLPYSIEFYRGDDGTICARVSMGTVTFAPHVLQGVDIQFAWDYQRAAKICLENEDVVPG